MEQEKPHFGAENSTLGTGKNLILKQKNQDLEQEKPYFEAIKSTFGAEISTLGTVKMTFGAREKISKSTKFCFQSSIRKTIPMMITIPLLIKLCVNNTNL